jgi:hypothetical protein
MVALPSTPIFGGVKHFLPAMPFLCVVAGAGAAWLITLACKLVLAPTATAAGCAGRARGWLLCLPAVAETVRSHPDGLGHYNMLAGGFAGGASLGHEPAVLGLFRAAALALDGPASAAVESDLLARRSPRRHRHVFSRWPAAAGHRGRGRGRASLGTVGSWHRDHRKAFHRLRGTGVASLRHHAAVHRLHPRGRALRGRLRAPPAKRSQLGWEIFEP